jgi:hypothetical protein
MADMEEFGFEALLVHINPRLWKSKQEEKKKLEGQLGPRLAKHDCVVSSPTVKRRSR